MTRAFLSIAVAALLAACGDARELAAGAAGGPACASCHEAPPATGWHDMHTGNGVPCASCHPGYSVDPEAVSTATHQDGSIEASPINTTATLSAWPPSCTDCHTGGVP